MNTTLILLVLLGIFSSTALSGRVVCYFASWTLYRMGNGMYNVSHIDPHLCTHIMFGFVGLDEQNANVVILDPWEAVDLGEIKSLVGLKQQNPNLKVLLCMGGWNEGSQKYSEIAANPILRATMVKNVVDFVNEWDFDGFDFDWEYPAQRGGNEENDKANFITWLSELRDALHAHGKILTAAVSAGVTSASISYDTKAVSEILDMVNVMTYDFHGAWENLAGHNAPLYSSHLDTTPEQRQLTVDAGIQHWINGGADPSKLNLGIPTYGRGFTLADPSNTTLYAPTYGPSQIGRYTQESGILGYNEICEFYSGWQYVWDDEQKVPHIISGNQWVGYDNVDSIKIKVEYAKSQLLGGIMIWSLDTDDFHGICGNGKYPLLHIINEQLNN